MERQPPSPLLRYSVAPASVLLALGATAVLPPARDQGPSTLFFAAVTVSSWLGGLGPGLAATLLSATCIDYFLVPPAFSLAFGWGDAGRNAVFVGVALLVSWLNRARDQLEGRLRRKAQELAEADARKNRLIALVAHELGGPLGALLPALQVPRRGTFTEEGRALDLAERQARQMARLVEDLLDVSRAGQGKLRLRKEHVELAAVVRRAVDTARPLLEERRHAMTVSVPDDPVWLEADTARLEQILVNLLTNAARHTPEGGSIRVAARLEGEEAVIRVADSGEGIPPALLPRVFDPFVQAEEAGPGRGGLGIGLYLVRELAELHGGSAEAWSEGPGRGSEFAVWLPGARAAGQGNGHPPPGGGLGCQ